MAQFEFNVVLTSAITWAYGYRTVEKGRLKSLSVMPIVGTPGFAQTFLIIGTTLASPGDDRPSGIFFSGYVTSTQQFIWSGDYPFSPFEFVFGKGRSMVNVTLRIVGVTELGDP